MKNVPCFHFFFDRGLMTVFCVLPSYYPYQQGVVSDKAPARAEDASRDNCGVHGCSHSIFVPGSDSRLPCIILYFETNLFWLSYA